MIIGNGLVASSMKLIDQENVVFFASGVSNSLETNPKAFDREYDLLKNVILENPTKKIIYFSTLSIEDKTKQDSPYILHKLQIEKYIQENCKHFLILRIGNIVGHGGNPNTLFNFLKESIKNNIEFNMFTTARRLLIDIDDITGFIKDNLQKNENHVVNLGFPYYYSTLEIVKAIEYSLNKIAIKKSQMEIIIK
jgi:nucleoside-diphosphate-sugar epimerase